MKVLFEFPRRATAHQIHAANALLAALRAQLEKGENVKTVEPGASWFAVLKKRLAYHPDIVHRECVVRRAGLHRARTFVLPGIDPAEYRPRPAAECEQFRRRLHLPEKYLLMCGPDIPVRNLMPVVSAMRLMDSTETLPLAIIGLQEKSDIRHEIERRKMDDSFFLIDDLPESERPMLFAAATLFLDPGLGAVARQGIVEAMACGVPVVASATLVSRKLFGGTARLVHPKDPMEWARALRAAQISLEWHGTAAARGLALARQFEWPAVAARLLKVYRTLAAMSILSFGRFTEPE